MIIVSKFRVCQFKLTMIDQHGVKLIVVLMHWGSESSYHPEETVLTVARQLAGMGVSAVMGHHPNTLHDHAYFGNTLVVFSLGKLLSSTRASNYCWTKVRGGHIELCT